MEISMLSSWNIWKERKKLLWDGICPNYIGLESKTEG
jgi:hypothetical protein